MIGAMPAERLKELMAEHLATVHRTPYVIEFVHFHHDMFKVELPITKCGEAVVARIAAVEMALNIGCGNIFPQGHAQRPQHNPINGGNLRNEPSRLSHATLPHHETGHVDGGVPEERQV